MRARRGLATIAAAAVLTLAVGCGDSADSAAAKAPSEFFGIAPQLPATEVEFARMGRGNVGSFHLLIPWSVVERSAGFYDWTRLDAELEQLAIHGIEPLAYIYGTPAHLAGSANKPPTSSREALTAWATFLKAVATRYAPRGDFWEKFALTNPGVPPRPIRIIEPWNEVNGPAFWKPEPSPSDYGKLLRVSERALHSVDPTLQVMVAGMFATPANEKALTSFDYLRKLFKKQKVRDAVDLVGAHPYGPKVKDVRRQLAKTYREMKRAGLDQRGIWVTEIGWGSNPSIKNQLTVTRREQAKLLEKTYKMLLNKRGPWNIQGGLWYTWRDPGSTVKECVWCRSAGLFDGDLDPKPAWKAFTGLSGGQF